MSSSHKGKGPLNPKQGEEPKVLLNRAASQDLAQPGQFRELKEGKSDSKKSNDRILKQLKSFAMDSQVSLHDRMVTLNDT